MNGIGIKPDRRQYLVCAALLGIAYLLCYGWLLWTSDFLPYVMDNNESFSSFWHAYNLWHFDFSKSVGLADEAFSYSAAAHPYTHTHQGNFPRIFNFLIYSLGARTIESQILVTTFTAGVAAIFFAYHFFSKIATPLFALIFCLLLITDYVLVAQWQVVTYRVWHMFFLFSTLLCAQGIGGERRRLWLALTLANYACLFYFELIFVAFVSICAGLYTAWVHRGDPKTVAIGWLSQFSGAIVGLAILVIQLTLYMGWDGFVQDAYLTFVARNEFKDTAEFMAEIKQFYEGHNIAFWYNLEDGSRFRKIGYFIASITYYELQVHTPFFFMVTSILAVAFVLGHRNPATPAFQGSADRSRGHAATWKTALTFPVAMALGMVAVQLFRGLVKNEIGLASFAMLLAMSFLLIFSLLSESLWSRLLSRTAKAWPNIDWRARLPHVVGILILLTTLPSVLTSLPSVRQLFPLQGGWLLLMIFVGTYFLLLAHLAADLVWRRAGPHGQNPGGMESIDRGIAGVLLYVSFFLLWAVSLDGDAYLGLTPSFSVLSAMDWHWAVLIAVTSGSYAIFVCLVGASRHAQKLVLLPRAETLTATRRFSLFVMLASAFVAVASRLFYQKYAILWQEIAEQSFLSQPLLHAMLATSIVFGGGVAAFGGIRYGEPKRWGNVLAFLISGALAYAIVYYLSPGYIFSGYRFRFVPFSVFHTELIIAVAFYLAIRFVLNHRPIFTGAGRSHIGNTGQGPGAWMLDSWGGRSAWYLAATLLVCLLVYWLGMQRTYVKLLPPDHFSVFKTLGAAPYRGSSFAVGNYAAPVAAYTGQWAYYDPALVERKYIPYDRSLIEGKHIQPGTPVKILTEDTYRWLADKETNPEYRQPQYFICLVVQAMPSVLSNLKMQRGFPSEFGGCTTQYLVRWAMQKRSDVYPRIELVAIDQVGPQRVGFDSWAIVKLTWDAAAPATSTGQKEGEKKR